METTAITNGEIVGCWRGFLFEIPSNIEVPVVDNVSGYYWIIWEDHKVPVLPNCVKFN